MEKVNGANRLRRFDVVKNWRYYLMTVPALVVFFLFSYLPMPGIVLAFKNYNFKKGIFGSPWVGFDNFRFYFESPYFWPTLRNTIIINVCNLIVGTVLAVSLAILLNELRSKVSKRLYQNFIFLPYFISVIAVGRFVGLLFSSDKGLVNQIITLFGGTPVDWYSNPKPWVAIIVGFFQWKGIGYSIIVYLASITGIDPALHEAAMIDGASRWQRIRHITLPLLKPLIIIMTLMSIGRIFFGDFQMVFAITGDNGRLMETTDIIETFMFRSIRTSVPPQYGMSTAIGLFQSVLGFVAIFGSNWLIKRKNPDYALF